MGRRRGRHPLRRTTAARCASDHGEYPDRPPPDNFPCPSTPAPTIQQKPADPEQKAIDDKVKQQVAKEEAERKQFCEETRNNLAQLKNNPRVRVDEGKGELRRLGEEERQERIAKAEKAIQENCR
ncbi:hypothetical protein BANRA_01009 [Pseudomonas aeruginosa]|nr:hypothetical protein BANRA_02351 [Pseudomonas aeruginosa]VCY96810.1 hypothetical protein BANRA_01009 [Pseudomonas aeruginosa]